MRDSGERLIKMLLEQGRDIRYMKLAVFIRDCGNELRHNGDYVFRSQLSCSDCWLAKVAQNLNAKLGACWDVLIQDWILSAAPSASVPLLHVA